MSESDIIVACEAYINRTFDEDDVRDLRKFLNSLQKQRTPKPVVEKKPEKLPATIIPRSSSDLGSGKPSYVKEHNEVDTAAIREERLAEAKGVGVKDRLGNWQQKIAADEDSAPQTDEKARAERLAEAQGVGVKDRLGNWQQKIAADEDSAPQTDEKVKAERLAELKTGSGLKDRLGAYQAKASEESTESKTSERVAEIKQSGSGLKDRLGAYQQAAESERKAERVSDIQPTASLKERMNSYVSTAEDNSIKKTVVVDDEEVKRSGSVSSRLANWNKVAESNSAGDSSSKIAEINAEAKSGGALKDRVNVWANAGNESEVKTRKEPIVIDYGF